MKPVDPEVVTPETTALAPATMPTLQNMIQVSNEDVVSIAVVQHEETLETEKTSVVGDIGATTRVLNSLEKQKNDLLKVEQKKASKNIDRPFRTMLAKFVEPKVLKSIITVPVFEMSDNETSFKMHVGVSDSSYHKTGFALKSKTVKLSKAYCDLRIAIRNTMKKLRGLQDRLTKISTELRNITKIERRAKARMAAAVLSKSEEGKAMLKSLTEVGSNSALQLNA